MKNNKIFKCTSMRFKNFLDSQKIDYIWVDVDYRNITFYLYEKNNEFISAQNLWNYIKNNK